MKRGKSILQAFRLLDKNVPVHMTDSAVEIFCASNDLSEVQADYLRYKIGEECRQFKLDGTIQHTELAKQMDMCVVCPCSFNTVGKIANGISDNFVMGVISCFLGTSKPLYLVESVNEQCHNNPFYQKNKNELLKHNNIHFIHQKTFVDDSIFDGCVTVINEIKKIRKEIYDLQNS